MKRIKARIEEIEYKTYKNDVECYIKYRWICENRPIFDTNYSVGIARCDINNTYNLNFGKNLARAKAELGIYQRTKRMFGRYQISQTTASKFRFLKDLFEFTLNNRKFYNKLIKKQIKYINSLRNVLDR